MSRILYFCPDFPQPSGGIKTLYRHVQRLVEQGFDAWIVHQKRPFRVTWHGYAAPTMWLSERPQFRPQDILVIRQIRSLLYDEGFTIGGARQRLAGTEARSDLSQSQQIIRQIRTELEDILKIVRR